MIHTASIEDIKKHTGHNVEVCTTSNGVTIECIDCCEEDKEYILIEIDSKKDDK